MKDGQDRNLVDELAAGAPMDRMRSRFDRLLEKPPRARRPRAWLALAAAAAIAIAGALLARRAAPPAAGPDAATRAVLAMLEAPAAFERLGGVQQAIGLPAMTPSLRRALLRRLESDDSINVRLAAVDAVLARRSADVDADHLLGALLGQRTAIVQAHLGYQLRRRRLVGEAELARIADLPEIHPATRNALTRPEAP